MITAGYHREIPQRYRLEAAKCQQCGKVQFPPRRVCAKCKSTSFERVRLSDEGKLLTFTVVRVASDRFSQQTPYMMGIVELSDGVCVTMQIVETEVDKVEIGQKVKVVFRRIQEDGRAGILCYGYKGVPA